MADLVPGDHIFTGRWLHAYAHHGIFIGNGSVIHYTGEVGKGTKINAAITFSTLEEFSNGNPVRIVRYALCLTPEEVVSRARMQLGQRNYQLAFNNCEHFATWCKTGRADSQQVTGFGEFVGGIGGAFVGIVGTVTAVSELGVVSGLSAAGVTSGLATIGGVIGGGMAAGIGLIAFVPAAAIAGGFLLGRKAMPYLKSEPASVNELTQEDPASPSL